MRLISASRAARSVALAAALLGALAAAGGEARASSPELGAFVGSPPGAGSLGVVVTSEQAPAEALAETLRQAGCDPASIWVPASGALRGYIPGAPDFVNAPFPERVPAGTQLWVRCRGDRAPAVDPANSAYLVEGEEVVLEGGLSDVPVAPGSATSTRTELDAHRAYGDLDGDGALDAAAALVQNPGGSGTFHYLAVSPGGSGGPGPTLFLGDRVAVERVAIAHGRVTVSYLARAFDAPMVSPPTIPVTRHVALEEGRLVDLGSGACEAPVLAGVGGFVIVTAPASGSEVLGRFTVSGCSRTFESTVNWRLLDRAGAEIASGHASGGGVDGPGRFSFTVEYDVPGMQAGRLEVFEVDPSGGEGHPPPMEAITLILN